MKKIIALLIILSLSLPVAGYAHTTLLSSNPAEGESVTEQPEEVELVFGTVIEEASTMTIEGESGTVEFENITVSDDTMTGTLSDSLPNGSYQIQWNIIGADGHPIEGAIPFAVDVEAAETEEPADENEETVSEEATEETAEDNEEAVSEEEAEEPAVEEDASTDASTEAAQDSGSNMTTILLIVIGALVVFGLYWMLRRKR